MGRPRDATRTDWSRVHDALAAIGAPDYPVVGREALLSWFHEHGFRCSWRTLLDWRRRCEEPYAFYLPAIGRHMGKPVSTHHMLLAWAFSQAIKLGVPGAPGWIPGPRALRKRRHRASHEPS